MAYSIKNLSIAGGNHSHDEIVKKVKRAARRSGFTHFVAEFTIFDKVRYLVISEMHRIDGFSFPANYQIGKSKKWKWRGIIDRMIPA